MSKLKPILTEKSLAEAKKGKYAFWVVPGMGKNEARKLIDKAFGVNVVNISSINYKSVQKYSMIKRRRVLTKARKKVIVSLSKNEKIDIFGETKKSKKKK